MPDHLHILIYTDAPDAERLRLSGVLGAFSKKFHPLKSVWMQVPEGQLIPNSHHLKRQIRYVHLNPCREGLVNDPIIWEWSTHRDYLGCVHRPWLKISLISKFFCDSQKDFTATFHRYVSSDPSVSVTGSPVVRAYIPGEPLHVSPDILLKAAAVVLREKMIKNRRGIVRSVAVHTANKLNLNFEAQDFGLSKSGLWRLLKKKADPNAVGAVLNLLVDPRLTKSFLESIKR
jgi:hypothetical protein